MEYGSQVDPTQPSTQAVFDPRREGKQNSGLSEEDVADIMCLIVPTSAAAHRELQQMAMCGVPYVVSRDDLRANRSGNGRRDLVRDLDLDLLDQDLGSYQLREYLIVLRLSDEVKMPKLGFLFGRSADRCDMGFSHDPRKRVSNVHFRIYVNRWGHIMIESQSTNGTLIDEVLLNKASPIGSRMATSGTRLRVPMHEPADHIEFVFRIPNREHDENQAAYMANVEAHLDRIHGTGAAGADGETTVAPDANGKIDAFRPKTKSFTPMPPTTKEWTGHPHYHKVGLIGRGAFAAVYRVTRRFDGQPFAAKELDKQRFIKNGVLDVRVDNEMTIMRTMKHPNIVRFVEHFGWDKLMIIIMDLVPCGDVGKYVLNNGPMTEPVGQTLAAQMLDALGYLHDLGVTHRDIKPDNILIDSVDPPVFKLTDFGLSKMVSDDETFLRTFCGTLLYCAPEVYAEYSEYDDNGRRSWPRARRPRYNHLVDIWSLGGVLYYCLSKSPPFPASSSSYTELLHRIMTADLDVEPLRRELVSQTGVNFVRLMLQRRPKNRANVAVLQGHLWLNPPDMQQQLPDDDDEVVVVSSGDEDEENHLRDRASQLSLEDGEPGGVGSDHDRDEVDSEPGDAHSQGHHVSHNSNMESTPQRGPPTVLHHQGDLGPILFGEVGISAINSSGVVVRDHQLNLSMSDNYVTEMAGDSDADSDYTFVQAPIVDESRLPSVSPGQSADQLPGLVQDVLSQDLNGRNDDDDNGNKNDNNESDNDSDNNNNNNDLDMAPPPLPPHRRASESRALFTADYNTSKRKDPPNETGDEQLYDARDSQSMVKRIKAGGAAELRSQDVLGEYRLLATIPPRKPDTRRMIDDPVSKTTFWEDGKIDTWHCNYPEMTTLQYEAFKTAASEHGYEFGPNGSPYWELAMRYFPPTRPAVSAMAAAMAAAVAAAQKQQQQQQQQGEGDSRDTSPSVQPDSASESADPVVVAPDPSPTLAWFNSTEESAVGNISLVVRDPVVTWGRSSDNTDVYGNDAEMRVPRYGFRILLWHKDYNASKKDVPRSLLPWNNPLVDADSYHFYISTKASQGICINGAHLPSSDPTNVDTRAMHWTPLYSGDVITVWDTGADQTSVEFGCCWGGSSHVRPRSSSSSSSSSAAARRRQVALVHGTVARKLDAIFFKTKKQRRDRHVKRLQDGQSAEWVKRTKNVEQERERSAAFEQKCKEAAAYLGIVQPVVAAERSRRLGGSVARSTRSSTSTSTPVSPVLTSRGAGGVLGMRMPRPAVTQ